MTAPIEFLITLPLSDELVNELRGTSNRLHITHIRASKPEEIPAEVWQKTEILYTSGALPSPEAAPNLKWIQFHWAGIDHAVDAPILKKPDLIVTTLSGVASSKEGEYIMMMLLALGQKLPELMAFQRKGEWPTDRWGRFTPLELRGSTVGIVGYGSIGRQVARLLREFGATVLAAKRDAMHPEDTGFMPEGQGDPSGDLVTRLYPVQALNSMIKECDFVIVSVPLTKDTRGLIGAEQIAAMKPGAYLIDISRGGIVEHQALIPALRDHKIAGAALDVFPEEPLSPESPLWKLPNVIITPHVSGISSYYNERALQLVAENLHRYLAGLPLFNRFDPGKGY